MQQGSAEVRDTGRLMELMDDEVHVWYLSLDLANAEIRRLLETLSEDERRRADRMQLQRVRDRFIAGRGILRSCLASYLNLSPARVVFHYGPQGKPSLQSIPSSIQFNLAHSAGRGVIAVTRGRPIGVDIEEIRPISDSLAIASRFFSPVESNQLRSLPDSGRNLAFLRCWTRKEAYLKALGAGLSRALDGFDVTLLSGAPPRLLRVEGHPGEATRWEMRDLRPGPGYLGAVATEGTGWRLVERTFGSPGSGELVPGSLGKDL